VIAVQFSVKKKRRVIINITSLIDVLFLLLIFFMVTSTFLEQPGMRLDLPSARSAEVSRVENLVLYIGAEGEIVFNDRVVAIDSLALAITDAVPLAEEKTLVLKADKTVQYGTVITVMDIAKQAGLEKLIVGTRIEGESSP
jgi:biopolymer transport protein ExbD